MGELIKNKRQFSIHIFIWAILYAVVLFFVYSEGKEITLKICLRIAFGAVIFYTNYSLLVPYLLLKKKKILYLLSIIILLIVAYLIISNVFNFDFYKNQNLLDKRPSKFIIIIFFNAVIIIIGTVIRVYEQWIENDKIKTGIEIQKNKTERLCLFMFVFGFPSRLLNAFLGTNVRDGILLVTFLLLLKEKQHACGAEPTI